MLRHLILLTYVMYTLDLFAVTSTYIARVIDPSCNPFDFVNVRGVKFALHYHSKCNYR